MTKKEVLEIRHQFAQATCSIDKICGCYVDGDRRKIATMKEAFLSLPEEEAFKYFEIFKKNLSGSIGKNLITMPFPTDSEFDGGTQEFLLKLRNSKLEDDELIDQFYDKVIENYDYTGNYLILLIHDTYDVPGKTTDGLTMMMPRMRSTNTSCAVSAMLICQRQDLVISIRRTPSTTVSVTGSWMFPISVSCSLHLSTGQPISIMSSTIRRSRRKSMRNLSAIFSERECL